MTGPRDNTAKPSVSVVIPAHNEAASIRQVVDDSRTATPNLIELIVVDDGSTDGTGALAAEAGAEVLALSPNRGKGCALRAGIEAARGDVLLFIDADGQDHPEEIPRLLDALADDVAMVIGSRFKGTLEEGSITRLNYVGNRALTWLFNRLYGSAITDTQAGFRVVRRDALDLAALRARRYEIETELTLHVLRRGGRIVEVPVTRTARDGGQTGFEVARDGLRILRRMVAGRFSATGRLAS